MRVAIVVIALTVAAGTLVPPARAGNATGAAAPYEDLVEVLATLTWHLRDDLYRFPAPKDPTGRDLFRLSLTRLESWEKRFPGRMRDVTAYGRAEALERLGEYKKAVDAYGQVAAIPGSPLAIKAKDAATRVQPLADAAALPEGGDGVEQQLGALRKKLDAWGALVASCEGKPCESLARVEEERLERATAGLVVDHRRDLEHGDETAEHARRFLIEKHADSKNLPAHVLRLGDLYADLAHEYLAAHDRPLDFDEDDFVREADRALETYHKVATWDGAKEKPEGQARFNAMEAWKSATLARYR
jgi:hypothetical protein